MKKKSMVLPLIAAPIALIAASSAMANQWGVTPYVGASAEWRHMKFERGFGDNMFKRDYRQGDVFGGVQFNDYLAVEAGYEATERQTRRMNFATGDIVTGQTLTAPITANSTAQLKALHADLIGSYSICDDYRLKAIALVGVARLKAKFVENDVIGNGVTTNVTNTYSKSKSVLRLGLGLQHMLNCNWGLRGMVKWENSKKLSPISSKEFPLYVVKPKNSVIYSLGLFYAFN